MLVSCILVSHNKPNLCHEAIQSVMNQTHKHWECLIVDSGVLYDQDYFHYHAWSKDPRFTIIRSSETELTRKTKAMAPWCFNECFRHGKVNGELVMYLSDDDILYPNAFETFVTFATKNPDALAMYASQDMSIICADGQRTIIGQRLALDKAGKFCNGIKLDCEVDYLQFCHRRSLLDKMEGQEWWPEGKDTERHADGVFMEQCGALTTIYPINIKVSQNRRAPDSLNCTTEQYLRDHESSLNKLTYSKRIVNGVKRRLKKALKTITSY